MSLYLTLEGEVRDIIRKNIWLILSTSSSKGVPQSSVVVYASNGYVIYILTGKNTNKVRNITMNPRVSVTIPFYKNLLHRMISVAPPAAISFRAQVETVDFRDDTATELYQRVLKFKLPEDIGKNSVWLKLTPGNSATCHGVGVSLFELRDPEKAHKIIKLTNTR
ncbi:pyridoxamine 5'-phosphate oxidase family protein [Thermoproteota archaeon]